MRPCVILPHPPLPSNRNRWRLSPLYPFPSPYPNPGVSSGTLSCRKTSGNERRTPSCPRPKRTQKKNRGNYSPGWTPGPPRPCRMPGLPAGRFATGVSAMSPPHCVLWRLPGRDEGSTLRVGGVAPFFLVPRTHPSPPRHVLTRALPWLPRGYTVRIKGGVGGRGPRQFKCRQRGWWLLRLVASTVSGHSCA